MASQVMAGLYLHPLGPLVTWLPVENPSPSKGKTEMISRMTRTSWWMRPYLIPRKQKGSLWYFTVRSQPALPDKRHCLQLS